MKILLISVHPVLEYDDIILFQCLGHQIVPLGFYFLGDYNGLRPDPISGENIGFVSNARDVFYKSGCHHIGVSGKWILTDVFCELFDLVIVHHNYTFFNDNFDLLKNKPVIWRTIGQELEYAEAAMAKFRKKGVKIVRWSEEEKRIPGYIGCDAVIPAYKNIDDYLSYIGHEKCVITFANNFKERAEALNYDFFMSVVDGNVPYKIFGVGNENIEQAKGSVTFDEQVRQMSINRLAFITGTWPAPYTLSFIECWISGIPVVHLDRRVWSNDKFSDTFEVDKLISHGDNGFLVGSRSEALSIISEVFDNPALAMSISEKGKERCNEIFGFDSISKKWSLFINTI